MPDVLLTPSCKFPWAGLNALDFSTHTLLPYPGYESVTNREAYFIGPTDAVPYVYSASMNGQSIPVSAKTTPYQINFGLGNASANDVHIILISANAPMKIEFFRAGDVSLGYTTVGGSFSGSDYIWVSEDTSPSWFDDGAGNITHVKVTRYDTDETNKFLYIDACSASSVAVPNTLLTGLHNYWYLNETTGLLYPAHGTIDAAHAFARSGTCSLATGKNGDGVDLSGNSGADYIHLNVYSDVYGELGDWFPAVAWNGPCGLSFHVKIDNLNGYILDHTSVALDFGDFLVKPIWLRIYYSGGGWVAQWRHFNGLGNLVTNTVSLPDLPATADGNWYNIVMSVAYDWTLSIYVDNVLQATIANGTQFIDDSGTKYLRFGSGGFAGVVDEIAFWTRALTATSGGDVEDLYNDGAGLFLPDFTT